MSSPRRAPFLLGLALSARVLGLALLATVACALAGCGRGGNESAQPPVKQASGPPGPPAAKAPGSTELSDEAQEIAFVTRRAADRGNFVALRRFLGDDYRWVGPDKQASDHLNADQAIGKWKEHQELLETLVQTVDKGCAPDGTERVVCPAEALTNAGYKGYVAGYTHQKSGDWKMTAFENRG